MIDYRAALIQTMFLVSAADEEMTDAELQTISEIVSYLPVFRDYDKTQLAATLEDCAGLLADENGLDLFLKQIKEALPAKLRDTAYALACDVVAADGEATREELRILEMLRHKLGIDRLIAAAIERGARARYMTA
jgi:tellurite resistance protein